MNEQLKQFATQAWNYANKNSQEGDGLFGNLQLSKFAELIVKECAKIATDHHENDECGHPGTKIENHFGVK